MFKATPSNDGVMRATLNVNFRISRSTMVLVCLSILDDALSIKDMHDPERVRQECLRITKTDLRKEAIDCLQDGGYNWTTFGIESMSMWQEDASTYCEEYAEQTITRLFPQLED
jgi:hypothetical protein